MALFKILRGPSSELNKLEIHDGWCYFTPDTGLFYIDYNGERIPLNAVGSSSLDGAVLEHDTLNDSEVEIPSSALLTKVIDAVNNRINVKADDEHTHTKSEITDFPTIPTLTSQLVNDSGFKTTDNNTTYNFSATANSTNGRVNIKLVGNDDTSDSIAIFGTGGTTVTTDTSGNITVNGTAVTFKTWTAADMV